MMETIGKVRKMQSGTSFLALGVGTGRTWWAQRTLKNTAPISREVEAGGLVAVWLGGGAKN